MTKAHEKYYSKFIDKAGKEFELVGEYINAKTKVKVKHVACNYTYMVNPSSPLRGVGCPNCARKRVPHNKKTHEEFAEEAYTLLGDDYVLLDKYVNVKTKVKLLHKKCNNIIEITPDSIISGSGCFHCRKSRHRKTHEQFEKEVLEQVGNEYTFLGQYELAKKKILVRHNVCNHEYEVSPNNFLRGYRCPVCTVETSAKKLRFTHEIFEEKVKNIHGDEFVVIGVYKNARTRIEVRHNKCGNNIFVIPDHLLNGGSTCAICSETKGEKRVRKWLEEKEIDFEPQKEFEGLIGTRGGNLSYDFYLPTFNLLIEYQGEFHDGSGGEYTQLNLENQQEHDRRKREYALRNGINLLEIWYYDYENVETILSEIKEIDFVIQYN